MFSILYPSTDFIMNDNSETDLEKCAGNVSNNSSNTKQVKKKDASRRVSSKISLGVLAPKHISQSNVNPKFVYSFSKTIVRIEYPGLVRNVAAAINTLGGMHGIQTAVADPRNKLELHFHPENKFCKPCYGDRELNPGILIRVKNTPPTNDIGYDYEVIGITSLNFKFNRLCDFQYLPLLPTDEAGDNVECVYNKILPERLPNLEWFLLENNLSTSDNFSCRLERVTSQPLNDPIYQGQRSKESCNQPNFYIPPNFARFDSSQNKLYLNAGEKYGTNVRPELTKYMENSKANKKTKYVSTKQVSKFVNFQIPDVKIPDQPLTFTMKLIKERNLEQFYNTIKKLFEERPIWSKVAVQYKTGINKDQVKIVLPAIAYFCSTGPWRMTWVRYGYNPQKDFSSRIYQTLDYRIRATEGTKLKVSAKRSYTSTTFSSYLTPNTMKKISLKDDIPTFKKPVLEERGYVLRPSYIPPARQMFYQYCDILLPEIQEMVSRLPKLPAGTKYDTKNGWLPVNFTEQCREIVNKYVMDRVQEELLEDTIKLQQQQFHIENVDKDHLKEISPTFCSKMLNNIKKGIYKSGNTSDNEMASTSRQTLDTVVDFVDLVEEIDGEALEQVNADDVVNFIPERMDENSDDEHFSESSDLDIDMEAVEEVNKMIAGIHDDEEVNVVSSHLTKKL